MKRFYEPELDSKTCTSVLKYLFVSITVIVLSYFSKLFFVSSGDKSLPIEICVSIASIVQLIFIISLVPILWEIIAVLYTRIFAISVKNRSGTMVEADEIIDTLDRIHAYYYVIRSNDDLIKIGSRYDPKIVNGSRHYYDAVNCRFFIDENEYNDIKVFKRELLKLSDDNRLCVVSRNGRICKKVN